MANILEVPEVRRRVAPISVEAYHVLLDLGAAGRRTELLRGTIIEKMTKSPLHVVVVSRLVERLSGVLPPGHIVRKEDPLTLVDSEPEPDIAVVGGTPSDFRAAHPRSALLAIEVAVRTEETDREKASIYARAGVGEYWLVLPETRTIEISNQPIGSGYLETRVVSAGEIAASRVLPGLQVNLDELLA